MRGIRETFVLSCFSLVSLFVVACGAATPPPEEPTDEEYLSEDDKTITQSRDDESGGPRKTHADDEGKETHVGAKSGGEPAFTEGMSVDQAIKAVPSGGERMNIDEETLGRPLQDMEIYKPCKPTPSQHVKMRIAIWEGKAVGMDITGMPKNKTYEDCIRKVISEVTWKDKVKSLNTIEYGF
jgi:hypothetical protein